MKNEVAKDKQEELNPSSAAAAKKADGQDLSDELNVDASMFNERELSAINDSIERFLLGLKEQEGARIRDKLFSRPLKRVFVLPLIIVAISLVVLAFVSSIYVRSSLNADGSNATWVDSLFAVRTSAEETAEISEATRELISGIRNESEEQIVELFVDLINVENAERSVEEGRSPAESDPQGRRAQAANEDDAVQGNAPVSNAPTPESIALQRQIEALKTELNDQIAASVDTIELEEFRQQSDQLQEQQQSFQTLQGSFQSLSTRYDQANLQTDQYASLVIQIDEAIGKRDFSTVTSLLQQFDAFLNNRSIRNNPLLRDLLRTGPAFSNSVRLYLFSEGRGQETTDLNLEKIRRLESEITDRVSEIRQLSDRNQELSIENREYELAAEGLQTQIEEEINLTQQQYDAEIAALQSRYETDIDALQDQHANETVTLQSQYESNTGSLQEQHTTETRVLQARYDTDTQALQAQIDVGSPRDVTQEYKDQTEALQAEFEDKFKLATQDYNAETEILQTQLQQVLAELQNIRRAR